MMTINQFLVKGCLSGLIALLALTSAGAQSLNGWSLIWSDEFNGSSLDGSKWQLENNEGDHGMSAYTSRPQNLSVSDGCLVLQAQKENYSGKPYTSTQVSSRGKGFWKYGRFDIRAKLPYGQGMWPAIWMMPNSPAYGGWPRSGEIDIMENLGDNTKLFYSTLHCGTTNQMYQGTYTTPADQSLSDSFHVYTMIWDTSSFVFYFDSTHNYWNCDKWAPNNTTYPKPFDQPFFMMFDLAVGGSWGGPPDSSTVFPQKMLVDWIRVYKRQNTSEINRHAENRGVEKCPVVISGKWIEVDLETGALFGFTLHNMAGREVARLADGIHATGRIRLSIPVTLPRGIYVWKLEACGAATSGKKYSSSARICHAHGDRGYAAARP
jgi:beta-glucanase (GH16 family)